MKPCVGLITFHEVKKNMKFQKVNNQKQFEVHLTKNLFG